MSALLKIKSYSELKKYSDDLAIEHIDIIYLYNSLMELNKNKLSSKNSVWIYFIQEWEVTSWNMYPKNTIKIGYAKYPQKRIKEMQTGNSRELRFNVVFKSIPEAEKIIHKFFDEENIRGEWFKKSKRLSYFLDLFYFSKDFEWKNFN